MESSPSQYFQARYKGCNSRCPRYIPHKESCCQNHTLHHRPPGRKPLFSDSSSIPPEVFQAGALPRQSGLLCVTLPTLPVSGRTGCRVPFQRLSVFSFHSTSFRVVDAQFLLYSCGQLRTSGCCIILDLRVSASVSFCIQALQYKVPGFFYRIPFFLRRSANHDKRGLLQARSLLFFQKAALLPPSFVTRMPIWYCSISAIFNAVVKGPCSARMWLCGI